MNQQNKNDKVKYAIKLCSMICAFVIVGALMYYFCRMHMASNDSWATWYNFSSPYIAIANIIAFIGLTVAIYLGENSRQAKHEQINIQKTIIKKIQQIEIDLAVQTKILYKEETLRIDIYPIYISLYKYAYYFKNLPKIPIIDSDNQRKKDAEEMLEQFNKTRDQFIRCYMKYDDTTQINEIDRRNLALKMNILLAYLEVFEMSIINNISLDVVEPQ